jgi:hypothetical protein
MSKESDFEDILVNGINFGRGGDKHKDDGKVKTKAKKKQYITGAHGSGSARQSQVSRAACKQAQEIRNRNRSAPFQANVHERVLSFFMLSGR